MEALTFGQSAHGYVDLGISLGLLVLNYFAVAQIITKAGFSAKWVLVPLAPAFLWFVTFMVLAFDVRHVVIGGSTLSVPVSLGNVEVLELFDAISLVVTWVFFLIFAFASWPNSDSRRGRPAFERTRQPDFAAVQPAWVHAGPTPTQPPNAGGFAPSPDLTKSPPPSEQRASKPEAPEEQKIVYCSWCGKSRAIDAAAIHHCGSRERPAAYCMRCGTPLEAGAAACATCGTFFVAALALKVPQVHSGPLEIRCGECRLVRRPPPRAWVPPRHGAVQ